MPEVAFRKYANRMLYDVERRSYVSVEKARDKLLLGGKVYTPQNRDVTAEVLVQLIAIDQRKGKRGLTAEKLREFIRSY